MIECYYRPNNGSKSSKHMRKNLEIMNVPSKYTTPYIPIIISRTNTNDRLSIKSTRTDVKSHHRMLLISYRGFPKVPMGTRRLGGGRGLGSV